ncbi:MAG: YcxB family protein [Emergencia sp.]
MKTYFENRCTYTYSCYLQLKRKTMDRSFVRTCYGALAVTLALTVLAFAMKWSFFGVVAIAADLFVLYRLIGTPVRLASFSAAKNREIHGQDVETVNRFYEDHVLAVNVLTGSKTEIPYTEVRQLLSTKDLFIIGMEQGLVLMIDKNGFTQGTAEEFRTFITEKCINAEVKL